MGMSQLYLHCSGELPACQRDRPALLGKTGVFEHAEGFFPPVCFCSLHVARSRRLHRAKRLPVVPQLSAMPGQSATLGLRLPAQRRRLAHFGSLPGILDMELSFDPSELQPLGEYDFEKNKLGNGCGRIGGRRRSCGSGASQTPRSPIRSCCF